MDQTAHQDVALGKRKHVSDDNDNDQAKSTSLAIATTRPRGAYYLAKMRRNQARQAAFVMRKTMERMSLTQTNSDSGEKPAPSSQPSEAQAAESSSQPNEGQASESSIQSNEAQSTESILESIKEAIGQIKQEGNSSLAEYEKIKNNRKENFGADIERLIERNKRRQKRLAQIEADLDKLTVMMKAQ